MTLNLDQIKNITHGAERIVSEGDAFRFFRFSEAEEALYRTSPLFSKTYAPAGVRMEFKTDASCIKLDINAYMKTSRTYFCFDIISNNKLVGCIKNYPDDIKNGEYPASEFPLGEYSGAFVLGNGEKHIKIYFPWSIPCEIKKIELVGASYITPVHAEKTILIYGDSITQGYDTLHPSKAYSVNLCDFLGAEGINKAIGGEVYLPELAEIKNDTIPDYVIAAYGINDWASGFTKDKLTDNCHRFWEAICRNYPSAKKFLITPIWTTIWEENKPMGKAGEIRSIIKDAVKEFPEIIIIDGINLVPHDPSLFGDSYLHPNDLGFEHYFANLKSELKNYI